MRYILILILFISPTYLQGQTKIITGKVIGAEPGEGRGEYEGFFIIEDAIILSSDSIELGRTNEHGIFEVQLPDQIIEISVGGIGMEWERVQVKEGCNHLEIILIPYTIYDFMSARKAERLRRKEREALPGLYDRAIEECIFGNSKPSR